jgi:hypothetical protein
MQPAGLWVYHSSTMYTATGNSYFLQSFKTITHTHTKLGYIKKGVQIGAKSFCMWVFMINFSWLCEAFIPLWTHNFTHMTALDKQEPDSRKTWREKGQFPKINYVTNIPSMHYIKLGVGRRKMHAIWSEKIILSSQTLSFFKKTCELQMLHHKQRHSRCDNALWGKSIR